jgi:hypothetical protein
VGSIPSETPRVKNNNIDLELKILFFSKTDFSWNDLNISSVQHDEHSQRTALASISFFRILLPFFSFQPTTRAHLGAKKRLLIMENRVGKILKTTVRKWHQPW